MIQLGIIGLFDKEQIKTISLCAAGEKEIKQIIAGFTSDLVSPCVFVIAD